MKLKGAICIVWRADELRLGPKQEVSALRAAHGAEPERIVAVCIERSVEMGAALLGVLASGAAYLPIDPSTPRARLRELIADSGAILVLTSSRLGEHCSGAGVPILAVDALPTQRAKPRGQAAKGCTARIARSMISHGIELPLRSRA